VQAGFVKVVGNEGGGYFLKGSRVDRIKSLKGEECSWNA